MRSALNGPGGLACALQAGLQCTSVAWAWSSVSADVWLPCPLTLPPCRRGVRRERPRLGAAPGRRGGGRAGRWHRCVGQQRRLLGLLPGGWMLRWRLLGAGRQGISCGWLWLDGHHVPRCAGRTDACAAPCARISSHSLPITLQSLVNQPAESIAQVSRMLGSAVCRPAWPPCSCPPEIWSALPSTSGHALPS